jgi:uncharacterized repeat protein (TIGR01451 family)
VLLALSFLFVPGALAVHSNGLFELDGNATDESAPGQDWNTALASSPSGSHIARVAVTDALNGGDDVFTSGSKDTNDISTWRWTTGAAPDKSDLEHAYASAYVGSDGHLYLYFGADRYAVNGDMNLGFWFLKNGGSKNAGTFSGAHAVGDIFVVSEFTQGGRQPEIGVYKWVGSGGSNGALDKLATRSAGSGTTLGCTSDDSACAIVNSGAIAAPITPYTPKSGTANTIPAGGFFEGGIDLSSLFPSGPPCVHGFIAETRASDQVDAELKDVAAAGGGLDLCSAIKVDKVTNPRGSTQSFNFTLAGGPDNMTKQFGLTDGAAPFDSGPLKPGTYSLSEAATAGWTQTGASCDNGSSPNAIVVGAGQTVTCTVSNAQNPTLTVTKTVLPSSDNGKFNLLVDGAVKATGGNGTSTGALPESIGSTHNVSETAAGTTDLSNYGAVIGGACNADGSITLAAGQSAVCTITNSRKPQVRVMKTVVPASDGGKFNLQINGGTKAAGVGDGGDTGFVNVDVGSNPTVGETADAGTTLTHYESSISCDNGASSSSSGPLAIGTLGAGAKVTCTITNSRTPQVTVTKRVLPSDDAGRFNLQINGITKAADAGDSGTTGPVDVAVGSNPTVGETAGNGTALSDYDGSISCDNGASGSGSGPLSVGTLHAGDRVSCVIKNSRKPEVRVLKHLVPSSDGGKFDLQVNGVTKAAGVGDHGDTGFVAVGVGSNPTVSEAASAGTTLGSYVSSISCDNGKSSSDSGPLSLGTLRSGDRVTCTITNARKPQVKVSKRLIPATDGGKFNLQINGTTRATDVGDGGTTGLVDVAVGSSPTVGETAGTGTSLGDYTSSISCSNGTSSSGSGPVSVGTLNAGDQVTCTITNTLKGPPKVTVTKKCPSGTAGPGDEFQAQLDGTSVGNPLTCGASIDVTVSAGKPYAIGEAAAGTTDLANYVTTLNAGCSGTLHYGDTAACTITNTLKAAPILIVIKHVINDNGGRAKPSNFTLSVTGSSPTPASFHGNAAGTVVTLLPGAYSVHEAAAAGYTASMDAGCSGTLRHYGDRATCTVTNDDVASSSPPTPPPPPTSSQIDLAITKVATPNPVTLGENVTYTLKVTNKGPDEATNVVVTDALPSETTFVSVSTDKGTCTGTNAITCNLGQVAVGEIITITIVVKPTTTGTITNTAVVAGTQQERDTSNNTASATVTVIGPRTPRSRCYALTIRPRSLTVGHRTVVWVKVLQLRKPVARVRVVVVGKGVKKRALTNARGVATVAINSRRPGILQIRVPTHSTCRRQRIGVVGVFTPPVTG